MGVIVSSQLLLRGYNSVSVFPYPFIVQKHHKSELYLSNVDTWIYYVIHQFIKVCSYVAAKFFAPYITTFMFIGMHFFVLLYPILNLFSVAKN